MSAHVVKILLLWSMTPWSSLSVYRRFGRTHEFIFKIKEKGWDGIFLRNADGYPADHSVSRDGSWQYDVDMFKMQLLKGFGGFGGSPPPTNKNVYSGCWMGNGANERWNRKRIQNTQLLGQVSPAWSGWSSAALLQCKVLHSDRCLKVTYIFEVNG